MRYNEKKGHWPMMKSRRSQRESSELGETSSGEELGPAYPEKEGIPNAVTAKVRSFEV